MAIKLKNSKIWSNGHWSCLLEEWKQWSRLKIKIIISLSWDNLVNIHDKDS